MKLRNISILIASVLAVCLLAIFSYYLSRGSVKGINNDGSTYLSDVKTPRFKGKMKFPVTITDSKGHQLTLKSPPKRIIVTTSEAVHCLIFLGKSDYIIGRLAHQDQPEIAHAQIVSGGSMERNYEAIANMKPDLILISLMNYEEQARSYEKYKLPYFAFKIKRINEMPLVYELFAKLLDADPKKLEELKEFQAKLDEIDKRLAGLKLEERPKVFYEQSYNLGPRTLTGDSIASEIIWRAGGRMFPVVRSFNAPVSVESLMKDPPDWYLIAQGFIAGKTTREEVKRRPMLSNLPCIANDKFLFVDSLSYMQCHPRTIDNIIELAKTLHPERMKDFK